MSFGYPKRINFTQTKEKIWMVISYIKYVNFYKKRKQTILYHPSSNSQVDRCNRAILQAFTCYIKDKQDTWDGYLYKQRKLVKLPKTEFTKNEMMLVRDVTQHLDIFLGTADIRNEKKQHICH